MPTLKFKKPKHTSIKIKAYKNCDDVQLSWRTLDNESKDTAIEGAYGFMVERQRMKDGKWAEPEILRNRVGFDSNKPEATDPGSLTRPSNIWPFQRYDWTDHGANNTDSVRYRVSALGLPKGGKSGTAVLETLVQSKWSETLAISGVVDEDFSVFFNRGAVMSQYVSRVAREKNWDAGDIRSHIEELEEPLRIFLSGELRLAMLGLLDNIISNPFLELHAALYELSDPELIGRLQKIGSRAHIILSDGSNTTNTKPVKYRDGNAVSRKALKDAGVMVSDRMLEKLGLGHNKILITVDSRTDKALTAFTGSTNWSPTGLCTQLNNGILLKRPDAVAIFYEYWKILNKAGSQFTDELMKFNGAVPRPSKNADIWFTRTAKAAKGVMPADLKYIQELINNAKGSILYVMFQPGSEPLASIINKRNEKNMYIRGVVSTVISSNREKFELMDEKDGQQYETDLIQPDGIRQDFNWWIKEVVRKEFLTDVGFAITHAKMIVIDAFGKNPVVITGSHNFSSSASQANDENFVVIRGNSKLAEHYAVACISTYNHYRWRSFKKNTNWTGLKDTPEWQKNYLESTRTLKHLSTWC